MPTSAEWTGTVRCASLERCLRPPHPCPRSARWGRLRQAHIYTGGVFGRRPASRPAGPSSTGSPGGRLSRRGYGYVAGGAGSERTMGSDRDAFERWQLVPRMLRDVSVRDTSVRLFGQPLPVPLLLAPIGALGILHREADVAVAKAAAEHGVPIIFSNQASRPMEDCAAAMGDAPRWFQLYWSTSDELVASLVGRAEAAGCEAIVVTLDTTMLGWRPRDLDQGYLPFALGRRARPVHQRSGVPARLAGRPRPARSAERPRLAELPASLRSVARMSPNAPAGRPGVRQGARADVPADLFTALADLGRPAVIARDDVLADRAEGHSTSRRRPARPGDRGGRDHRLHPRRPAGRRRPRCAGQPAARWSTRSAAPSRC